MLCCDVQFVCAAGSVTVMAVLFLYCCLNFVCCVKLVLSLYCGFSLQGTCTVGVLLRIAIPLQ